MVSPTRPSNVNTADASYSAVPNPQVGSPDLNRMGASPDINDPYANLSGQNLPRNSYLSPEGIETPILGRDSMHMPAPSMISRDSTHESLLAGTPNLDSNRSSWGSNAALAGGDVSGTVNEMGNQLTIGRKTSGSFSRTVKLAPLHRRLEQCFQ